jgi:hypothetical protein
MWSVSWRQYSTTQRQTNGCFKKRFTTLKAYINLLRGQVQYFELSSCSKTHRFTWDTYGSMWLPLVMKGVSKRALQYYSKCCCVASVKETSTLKVCTPLSVNVFVTLATQQHMEYHCKALFETLCIWKSGHCKKELSKTTKNMLRVDLVGIRSMHFQNKSLSTTVRTPRLVSQAHLHISYRYLVKTNKAIPVAVCGDPRCCETSRFLHFLYICLIDGSVGHKPLRSFPVLFSPSVQMLGWNVCLSCPFQTLNHY